MPKNKVVYLVEFDMFGPEITRVIVKSETQKSITVLKQEKVVGDGSAPSRITKSKYKLCGSVGECMLHLYELSKNRFEQAEREAEYKQRIRDAMAHSVRLFNSKDQQTAIKYLDGIDWFSLDEGDL